MDMRENAPRLLTSGELATLLGVDGKTIHNHVKEGLLSRPSETLGGHARFSVSAVIADYERAGSPVPRSLVDYRDGSVEALSGTTYWLRRASVGALTRELARRGVTVPLAAGAAS